MEEKVKALRIGILVSAVSIVLTICAELSLEDIPCRNILFAVFFWPFWKWDGYSFHLCDRI